MAERTVVPRNGGTPNPPQLSTQVQNEEIVFDTNMNTDTEMYGENDQQEQEIQEITKCIPYRKEADDATEKLAAFINEKIEYMNTKLTFAGTTPPSLYEIELALSTWLQTSIAIDSMYRPAQKEADDAEAELNFYEKVKYIETRNKYNTIDLKKSQWLSATEIDNTSTSIHINDLSKLTANVIRLKHEAGVLKDLQKSWDNYLWVLRTLKDFAINEIAGSRHTVDLRRGDEMDLM